jgi:hypothetical protein
MSGAQQATIEAIDGYSSFPASSLLMEIFHSQEGIAWERGCC